MNQYSNPLVERYGSKEMLYTFSPEMKFSTWRKLWIALAESEQELGLAITDEQLQEMKTQVNNIDFKVAAQYEKEFRHDVMAHVHAFGDVAPAAKPIIHLGATSAFVGDNTDIIQHKEGLQIIKKKLINVMHLLGNFAKENKGLPTLGFTHYQPAQLTTVGKRATLWLQSLLMDIEELEFVIDSLKLRGVKGTTGTGASYKDLFEGDYEKLIQLDEKVAQKMGFKASQAVTGQTYDRKVDSRVLNVLSSIAQSAHKFTNDLRLLSNLKEMEEPFAKKQIGSSAMAYKRNPMRSERISSLAKFVIALTNSPAQVAATQWFERTLDDSANKRLSIPQAFLATDALLSIWHNVVDGMVVYPKVIEKHVMAELPFMMTEMFIMEGVKAGGDRQELHESIRVHSIEAGLQVKQEGKENDLLERIANDKTYPFTLEELKKVADPKKYTGFAEQQTVDFLHYHLNPVLEKNKDLLGMEYEMKV
ncbi:adenylosuccinate lyase [Flavobacteriaceae bacterium UJ101]|nr:adenylosuccinate lyase [Flavobacteriaceae bacterium UJ101]